MFYFHVLRKGETRHYIFFQQASPLAVRIYTLFGQVSHPSSFYIGFFFGVLINMENQLPIGLNGFSEKKIPRFQVIMFQRTCKIKTQLSLTVVLGVFFLSSLYHYWGKIQPNTFFVRLLCAFSQPNFVLTQFFPVQLVKKPFFI